MRIFVILFLSVLVCKAGYWPTNWVQVNTNSLDVVADGRPETVQEYKGQSPTPGWQIMTAAELDAALESTADAQDHLNRVVRSIPVRQAQVGIELQNRLRSDSTWDPKELRILAIMAETCSRLVQVAQLQAEYTRLLGKGVNLAPFWSNLSNSESNRAVELRSMLNLGTGDDLTTRDKQRAANGLTQLQKVVDLWEFAKTKYNEISTNTSTVVNPRTGWPSVEIAE